MVVSPHPGGDQSDIEEEGPSIVSVILLVCSILAVVVLGALAAETEVSGRTRLAFACIAALFAFGVLAAFLSWQRRQARAQQRLISRIAEWESWHARDKDQPAAANASGQQQAGVTMIEGAQGPPPPEQLHSSPPLAPPAQAEMPPMPPGLPGMPPGPTGHQYPPPQQPHQSLSAFADWTHGNAPKSGPLSKPAYPKPPPGVPPHPGWTDSSELGARADPLEQAQLQSAMAATAGRTPATDARVTAAARHVRELLKQHHAKASVSPLWGQEFWNAIVGLHGQALLPPAVLAVLQSYGYIGIGTLTASGRKLSRRRS